MQFVFEVLTDVSLLPSLVIIYRRRRHWDFFIGAFQLLCSLMYNVCDSLDVSLFLGKQDWHRLTNVSGLAYGVNVIVYLMMNGNESMDQLFRYSTFAALWIAQIKDEYWMEETQYTLLVIFIMLMLCAIKLFARGRLLFNMFDKRALKFGALFATFALLFFLLSLDDANDLWRWKHGVAQCFFGAAIYNLWRVVPNKADRDLLP